MLPPSAAEKDPSKRRYLSAHCTASHPTSAQPLVYFNEQETRPMLRIDTTHWSATALSCLPKASNLESTLTPGTAPHLRRLAFRRSSATSNSKLEVRDTWQGHLARDRSRCCNVTTVGVCSIFIAGSYCLKEGEGNFPNPSAVCGGEGGGLVDRPGPCCGGRSRQFGVGWRKQLCKRAEVQHRWRHCRYWNSEDARFEVVGVLKYSPAVLHDLLW